MSKNIEILAYQKEQSELKKEIQKIKKSIPIYLTGIVFFMFLIVFVLDSKVYTYFGGSLNFFTFSSILTLVICFIYFYTSQFKIKEKEKSAKAIGSKLYNLMKLENE